MRDGRFGVLAREFFAQFFASESATSDHEVRRAIIGVLAFLLTPAVFVPLQFARFFELAAMRYATRPPGFPGLLEPLIRIVATLFVAYATVSVGIIAALAWDRLVFDRRDAMVLGPMPVGGSTIVGAKLAALAALLLMTTTVVSVTTAVPLAIFASGFSGIAATARHLVAHLIATTAAALFVFCALVTVRALLGTLGRGSVTFASIVQFVMISCVLGVLVLIPATLDGGLSRVGVSSSSVLDWSPVP